MPEEKKFEAYGYCRECDAECIVELIEPIRLDLFQKEFTTAAERKGWKVTTYPGDVTMLTCPDCRPGYNGVML